MCELKQETLPTSSDVKKQFSFSKIIFGEDSVRRSVFFFVCLAAFFFTTITIVIIIIIIFLLREKKVHAEILSSEDPYSSKFYSTVISVRIQIIHHVSFPSLFAIFS